MVRSTQIKQIPPRPEQEILNELSSVCRRPGFIHALAYLACRDDFVEIRGEHNGNDFAPQFSTDRLIRTEICTLHGLMLKHDIDATSPGQVLLKNYADEAERLLSELHRAMAASLFSDSIKAVKAGLAPPKSSADALREPIFYGAESAYPFQYIEFAQMRYSADANWIKGNCGFDIAEAASVVDSIFQLRVQKVAHIAQGDGNFIDKDCLWALTFTPAELAQYFSIQEDKARLVCDYFSPAEDDDNSDFVHLNDFNIANAKPLVRCANDTYLCFHQQALAEALYESPYFWMLGSTYESQANANRGVFTEELCTQKLTAVFGKNAVFQNVAIRQSKGKDPGEIDALVLFGNRAIVVQAKSKKLTLAARKGNDLQLKKDFKASTQDAYDQAFECAELLKDRSNRLEDEHGNVINLPEEIKEIYLLCVVSDHYPALFFQADQFLKTKSSSGVMPPMLMDVFALDATAEFLDSPLRFLSYINRRTHYRENVGASNELVILAYHIQQNLWLNGEFDHIWIDDTVAADLDAAMAVRRQGIPGPRTPEGILTKLKTSTLGHVVAEIEHTPVPSVIDLGFLLLELGQDSVENADVWLKKAASLARQDNKCHDFSFPLGHKRTGLTVHVNPQPRELAEQSLFAHCQARKYACRAESWHGICLDPHSLNIKFGAKTAFPWLHDNEMEEQTASFKFAGNHKLGNKNRKIGRNDRCPCGSGQKYKRCCLLRGR